MKSIFARHGIPSVVVNDNATCYSSRLYREFAEEYTFLHRTSSPGYAQSNGKVERGVGIVTSVLNKAFDSNADLYLSLLAYHTAPMACGKSPSEMLMNRKLRNRLPQVSQNVDIDGRQQIIRQTQMALYNKHVKDLPVLEPNDVIRVRKDNKWETKGYVIVQLGPRSDKIRTEDGRVIRRNRRQLIKTIESCSIWISGSSGSTLSIDVDSSKSASNDPVA